jgi:hypothetical protein
MTEPGTGRVTDSDRLAGSHQEKQVQDTSTDTMTPARMAQLGGLTAALAVGLYVLRELLFGRKQKTRSELFAEAAKAKADLALAKAEPTRKAARKAAKKAAKQYGPVAKDARKKAGEAAKKASEAAVPVALAGAGAVAATAGKVGSEVASRAADVSTEVVAKAAGLGAGVAAMASEIGDEVGDTVHGVQKKVRKTKRRLFVLICLGIGYVLGARAGRERYDQIVAQAQKLAGRPEVQDARHKVADKLDEVTGQSSSSSSSGSATTV